MVVECELKPVIAKVSDMASKAVLALVAYRHSAASSVVTAKVVEVVPDGSTDA
jgi:hypothetical protein